MLWITLSKIFRISKNDLTIFEGFSGHQCETDLINECKSDTCSAQGMCQDRAEKDPVCLCPIVGEYSQPKLVILYS